MITVPKPNSPASAFTCTWDAWNRLVEVKDKTTNQTVALYAYDGLNHRISKTVGDTIQHAYYNVGWQLLETRVGAGAPESLQPKYQYVWSLRYIDAPVCRDKNTDDDGLCDDERLHFTNDANMNVTALLDTDGTVLERYAYDPYGKPSFFDANWQPRSASAYDNSILYCGYYYDEETGLYNPRTRYYHCLFGCMITRDAWYWDGINLYEYSGSGPVSSRDPFGMAWSTESGPSHIWNNFKKCTSVSYPKTELPNLENFKQTEGGGPYSPGKASISLHGKRRRPMPSFVPPATSISAPPEKPQCREGEKRALEQVVKTYHIKTKPFWAEEKEDESQGLVPHVSVTILPHGGWQPIPYGPSIDIDVTPGGKPPSEAGVWFERQFHIATMTVQKTRYEQCCRDGVWVVDCYEITAPQSAISDSVFYKDVKVETTITPQTDTPNNKTTDTSK